MEPPASPGQQWQAGAETDADMTSNKLPSFYSPPTRPTAAAAGRNPADNDDVASSAETSLDQQPLASPPESHPALSSAQQISDRPSASLLREALGPQHPPRQDQHPPLMPPPSLLSPAFTPPGTPGTATPTTAVPIGVPVDSSLESGGGCGNKRPRLLETLPDVQCIVRARIPTVIPNHGAGGGGPAPQMFLHLYKNSVDDKEHLAIVFGNNIRSRSLDAPRPGETEMDRMIRGAYTGVLYPGRTTSGGAQEGNDAGRSTDEPPQPSPSSQIPLVRIHSECYTGETAWSARCDCGEQLDEAARLMSLPESPGGVIVYLRQEGRGIGLGEKLKAYNLQDLGSDTVEANLLLRHPADARSYGLATAILRDLGQRDIRLLTNNPDKIRAVEGPNREIVVRERVAMIPLSWRGRGGFRSREVEGYLKTKIEKMGHMLDSSAMPS